MQCQAQGISQLARKPVPVFDHPRGKEISKPPLAQLCAFLSCCIVGSQDQSPVPPFVFPLQGAAVSSGVTTQPYLLQTRERLCHQLLCPPLCALMDLNILAILWSPELHTILR